MLIEGNADCSLNSGQYNKSTQPPYGIEIEQQAIRQKSPNQQPPTNHVNTDSPTKVYEHADSHAYQCSHNDAGKIAGEMHPVHGSKHVA